MQSGNYLLTFWRNYYLHTLGRGVFCPEYSQESDSSKMPVIFHQAACCSSCILPVNDSDWPLNTDGSISWNLGSQVGYTIITTGMSLLFTTNRMEYWFFLGLWMVKLKR
jgi:hypothetical protein